MISSAEETDGLQDSPLEGTGFEPSVPRRAPVAVRGVFSGTLKKKLGLTVASAKEERGRVYRIAEPASR
jgi:hypothetical protein